jgi:hypothetical protein
MGDLTKDSDRILGEGRALVHDNRAGGRHRREGSIGQGAAQAKTRNWMKRLGYFGAALLAIFAAATVAGIVLDGIGFLGIVAVFFAMVVAGVLFANYPKVKVPKRADLTKTQDARRLVSQTELWLEQQVPALPAPAAKIVNDMGVQLDALGLQLESVEATHPAAQQVRKLVGEHLPETIESYRKIPAHLRAEERAGATPDAQVTDSLGKISKEIDHVTRQLADGHLDDLAVRTRYLDYAYGDKEALEDHSERKDG